MTGGNADKTAITFPLRYPVSDIMGLPSPRVRMSSIIRSHIGVFLSSVMGTSGLMNKKSQSSGWTTGQRSTQFKSEYLARYKHNCRASGFVPGSKWYINYPDTSWNAARVSKNT